jgi:hypothetical protein
VTSHTLLGEKYEEVSQDRSRYGRPDELRKARKIVNVFKTGTFVRATVYKYVYCGTVLGYKKFNSGWKMGLLLNSGKVKDVSIDPVRWFDGEDSHFTVVDKTVYVIFNHGYRLVIEPVSRTN